MLIPLNVVFDYASVFMPLLCFCYIQINMMAKAEILICVKRDKFNWDSEFLFLTGLCVFSKMKNIARIMLN